MCGIAGAWLPGLGGGEARALAERMGQRLRHRGPDGSGSWFDPEGASAPFLAHRRLSIVDLSPAGAQPMVSASGRLVIAFNGEVYNHTALRAELETTGKAPAWRGHSDTEVMLAAIEAWGLEAALHRFVGMFAFALWDTAARRLTLVRDRLGVKPLYVARSTGGVAFASELAALREVPGVDLAVSPEGLTSFLEAGCVQGESSIHVGVRRVLPGTWLSWDDAASAPTARRWWSAADVARAGLADPFRGTEEEAVEALEQLLFDAVSLRMVADVPLGAFLSGGVDSSVVVAAMQARSRRPVLTFSIGNEDRAYDESSAAAAVARHLGTEHVAGVVTARDALDFVARLPDLYDEPFADSSQIPTWLVSRLARQHVVVSLSGDGGDELFGGYVRHLTAARLRRAQRLAPRRLRHLLAQGIRGVSVERWDEVFRRGRPLAPALRLPGVRMHKLASALATDTLDALYDASARHWSEEDGVLEGGWHGGRAAGMPAPPSELADLPASWMMYRDLVGYLPDDVLTKVDRASMAVGLEAREPLLDHRLLDFAWRLPETLKLGEGEGKRVLRRVLHRHVPASLTSGPKMGFAVPLGAWLRGPLRPWAESLLDARALREVGVFSPGVVRSRWEAFLQGSRPWEHHLWDVLVYQAWAVAQRAPAVAG
jgi:asparagine synthase (glutamine-hydrolysing)